MSKKSLIIFFLIISLIYYALTTAFTFKLRSANGYYKLMADAFLKGKTYLLVKPNPILLTLPNPYDPIQNNEYRLHDASLYKEKYYLYWGPFPAIIRIIFFNKLPEPFFIYLYTLGCSLITLYILFIIKNKYFKKTKKIFFYLVGCFICFNGVVLNLLVANWIYYEAIASAQLFFLLGCLFLLKKNKINYAIISSIFFAFSVATRTTYLFPTLFLIIFSAKHFIDKKNLWLSIKKILYIFFPYLFTIFCLLIFNYIRFNDFFEFGTSYQLGGSNLKASWFSSIHNIPNNLRNYLFAIPSFNLTFPFIYIDPEYYNHFERIVFSIFLISPVTLLFFAKQDFNKKLDNYIFLLKISALIILVSISFLAKDSATRFIFDFIYLFNLVGGIYFLRKSGKSSLIKWSIVPMIIALFFFGFFMWLKSIEEHNHNSFQNIYGQYLRINRKINQLVK